MVVRANKGKYQKLRPYGFEYGRLYINCEGKNVKMSITDSLGRVADFISNGLLSLKHAAKKTPNATEESYKTLMNRAVSRGLRMLDIRIKGFHYSRGVVLKALNNYQIDGLSFLSFEDTTRIKYGGCRARKMKKK